MTNSSYTFNTDSGAAKSSDIANDNTTQDYNENCAEWDPKEESWEDFKYRTK